MILLLFIFHYSLYLLGAVTPQKPPRGVYCEYGESHAVALRKGMEAGTARCPRGLRTAHCAFMKNML